MSTMTLTEKILARHSGPDRVQPDHNIGLKRTSS